jgi:hypothetical protein
VDSRIRAIVMLIVSVAWLAYVGSELLHGRQPEVWTWGILTGVYAALYQPWSGREAGGRAGRQNGLPGPGLPGLPAPEAEDEKT